MLEDPVSPPSSGLQKTTRSSPHHVAEHRTTGSETTPPYAPWSSRFGSAPPCVEDDVDVWRYAVLDLHARNDDDYNLCIIRLPVCCNTCLFFLCISYTECDSRDLNTRPRQVVYIVQAVIWRSSTIRNLLSYWLSQWTRVLKLFTSWHECVQFAWALWRDGGLSTGNCLLQSCIYREPDVIVYLKIFLRFFCPVTLAFMVTIFGGYL